MRLDKYNFELSESLIAQYPPPSREDARLMILPRNDGLPRCTLFTEIVHHFHAGDVLVYNDTQVIPARLLGRKESGGKIEVLLVRRRVGDDEIWSCLTKSSKAPRPGMQIFFGEQLTATVLDHGEEPYRWLRFNSHGDFREQLERLGRIPLPPYILRDDEPLDRERYQTVFAAQPGAVAAPTAGLHFTPALLDQLRDKGVKLCPVTLHVGLGTFLPVRVEHIDQHRMHAEEYHVPAATAAEVNRARREGRRVVALGTTTTRTLESAADNAGQVVPGSGESRLFIRPGFHFQAIDAMITNFHLPGSTLLMMVAAFVGHERIMAAYQQAIAEEFRFFSYGDCMLIV